MKELFYESNSDCEIGQDRITNPSPMLPLYWWVPIDNEPSINKNNNPKLKIGRNRSDVVLLLSTEIKLLQKNERKRECVGEILREKCDSVSTGRCKQQRTVVGESVWKKGIDFPFWFEKICVLLASEPDIPPYGQWINESETRNVNLASLYLLTYRAFILQIVNPLFSVKIPEHLLISIKHLITPPTLCSRRVIVIAKGMFLNALNS